MPQTEIEWMETAADFKRMWNFNHCIDACDRKHLTIDNYKAFFSVVLFAVVNANYAFLHVQTVAN